MSLEMDSLIRTLLKAIRKADEKKTKPLDTTAEVRRVEGNTAWVHFYGGVDETPVKLTIAAQKGDIVNVRSSGGKAWITGNATAPPTDDTTAIYARQKAYYAEDVAKGADQKAETALNASKENAEKLATTIIEFNSDIGDLQDQIDGNITTWFYAVNPTNANPPASDWIVEGSESTHLGDLYYNTETGYAWRWQYADGQYSWQRISDTDVTKALHDAAEAKDIADRKRRVFYTTPVVPYDAGDLWVQGSGGDILRCATPKDEDDSYALSDWVLASKYTDDTIANQALEDSQRAKTAATNAEASASNAATSASQAATSAQAAQSSASTASTAATSAQSDASTAATSAQSAQSSANAAGESASRAQAAAQAAETAALATITTDTLHYLATSQGSGVTRETAGWSTTVQTMTSTNKYLWTYHTYTSANGTTTDTTPVITGTYGEKGADGTSVTILGSYNSVAELEAAHPTGNLGDAYMVGGDLYVWNGSAWQNVGQIKGDKGDTGEQGDTGVGVTEVQPQYYLSTSASQTEGGSWSNALSYVVGKYIWTRDKITYSDTTIGYSTEIYNQALTESCRDAAEALGIVEEQQEYFWHDSLGAHVLSDTDDVTGIRYRTDIKGAGQEVYRLNTDGTEDSVAKFGETARIGTSSASHVIFDDDSIEFMDGATQIGYVGADSARFPIMHVSSRMSVGNKYEWRLTPSGSLGLYLM